MKTRELEDYLKSKNKNLYIKPTKSHIAQLCLRNGGYYDFEMDLNESNIKYHKLSDGNTIKILGMTTDKVLMGLPYPNIHERRFPNYNEPKGDGTFLMHRSIYDVVNELKLMQLI